MRRLGQSANNAAVVIILIAVLIILYILFLPPEQRDALLGDGDGTTNGGPTPGKSVLYSKTPGRLYPSGANTVEHTMPSFIVYTVTNANELKRLDTMYVRNGAFGDQVGDVVFFYDPSTMSDLKLSFNVREHTGRLSIKLNNYQIYEGEITEGSPQPIVLPKEQLLGKNTITFEVSEPGIAFWRVNDYELESVLVSGRVTDYSGATSEQHFSIGDTEYQTLEKAQLEFLPDCPPNEAGQVQVLINGRSIYTGVPDCGVKSRIEVGREFLKPGDNSLVASTNTGSFLLDAPKLTSFLKASSAPTFYFNVPISLIEALQTGQRGLGITLRFADSTRIKKGTIEVNGFKTYFETQDFVYQTVLDPESILEGSNGMTITPQAEPMDVVELRVEVI